MAVFNLESEEGIETLHVPTDVQILHRTDGVVILLQDFGVELDQQAVLGQLQDDGVAITGVTNFPQLYNEGDKPFDLMINGTPDQQMWAPPADVVLEVQLFSDHIRTLAADVFNTDEG